MRRARRGCTHAQGSRGFDSQSLFAMRKRPRPRLGAVVLVASTRWRWLAEMVLHKRLDVLKVDLYRPGRYRRPDYWRCY